MGHKIITLKLPTGYDDKLLGKMIEKKIGTKSFTFSIDNKSLDARNKKNILWDLRLVITSDSIKTGAEPQISQLNIPYKKSSFKVVVVGSGPAGFFAAFVLQKAGFNTTLIERGTDVEKRTTDIDNFESGGNFVDNSNYAMGEGGAGTFSDGKLTSRSKRISIERQFILESYVHAGAPEEILYMTHPHLGSDNLKVIVKNLRHQFENCGGTILFETTFTNLIKTGNEVSSIETNKGIIDADFVLVAPGHSSYDTYRLLMQNGVLFRTKNFAIGSRMEHPQELINIAQWGKTKLPGVKAAEYRLTSKGHNREQVYSFCMCPGGTIVPAAATANTNIVNGMSKYKRDNYFANAACVATVDINRLLRKEINAAETLDWMEKLEQSFYNYTKGFKAPYCSISDFIDSKLRSNYNNTSYPMGIVNAPLWELLPTVVSSAMREGLIDFCKKIRGFESGNIMGLESKTSAPIQVLREDDGRCTNFSNLFVIGEGSGYAGGIISSAADGVKVAMNIISKHH